MSDLNKAVLKVANSNPEFKAALKAELTKQGVAGDGTYGWPQRNFPKIKQNARMAGQELLAIAKAENTADFWAHVLSAAQAQQQMLKALAGQDSAASHMGKVVKEAHRQLAYQAREKHFGTVGDPKRAAELSKEASPADYSRMAKIMMEMFDEGTKVPLEDNKSEVYPVAKKLKAAIDKMSSRPTNQGVHTIARYLHEFLIEAGYEVQTF